MIRLCRTVIISIALAGLTANSALAAVFVSDDFSSANLNPQIWSIQDPVGGATFSIVNNELEISIPGGIEHDVWNTGNFSARVMQPTDNVDFEIEIKFSSLLSQQYQMQGMLIEQDTDNFLRFDFYSDGGNVRVFAASFATGQQPSNIFDMVISPILGTLYMRVSRTVNQWTQSYSMDGQNWTNAANFSHALNVNSVGPYVGNAGSTNPASTPAFTGLIDYFFNTANPIDPEDGGVIGPDTTPPFIYNTTVTAVSDTEIAVNWATDEPADGFVEYGLTTAYELGSMSNPALTLNHDFTLSSLQPDTIYQIRFSSADEADNISTSQNFAVFTSALPTFDIWYGSNQSFGAIGQPQEWVNILGKVSDPDGIASLTVSLNGGPELSLSVGPDQIRLQALGDFNIDFGFSDLAVGQNSMVITAQDNLGFQASETVIVDYPGENHLALDYSIDWSTVANIQDVAQIVDGLWTLEADSVRPLELGYDRLIAIGDVQWQNYEITVPVTVHGLDPFCEQSWCAGGGAYVGVLVRWPGHYYLGAQPNAGWWPMGTLGGVKWYGDSTVLEVFRGSDGAIIVQDDSVSLPFEVPHMFKVRAETTTGVHRYSVKIWPQSEAEPAAWNFTFDEQLSAIDAGSALLVAHHIDASFGDVVVTTLDDAVPPIISDIEVTTTQNSATITWQTDEVSTSEVASGWSSAYELGTISDNNLTTTHSITLPKLWAGLTYHYQFSSTDSFGNTVTSADLTFTTDPFVSTCNGCHQ